MPFEEKSTTCLKLVSCLALGLLDGAGDALHGARVGGVLLLLRQLLQPRLRLRGLVPQGLLLLLHIRQLRAGRAQRSAPIHGSSAASRTRWCSMQQHTIDMASAMVMNWCACRHAQAASTRCQAGEQHTTHRFLGLVDGSGGGGAGLLRCLLRRVRQQQLDLPLRCRCLSYQLQHLMQQ
jgi:hypothetical protein